MKFVKVDPSLLDQLRQFVDANPTTLPAIAVLIGLAGAWVFASFLTR